MSHPLDNFKRQHDFLIGIDSDGCAFDAMEIKHKECFIPNFIKYFNLQPVSKYAREAAEFTNLYSKSRGANRFKSYTEALQLLAERPEVKARHVEIPQLQGVLDWMTRETKLGNPALKAEVEKTNDPDLTQALEWSVAVNETVADIVKGVPPFPLVRESLDKLADRADMLVCSSTPTAALETEWAEHGLAKYVQAICGQEAGSKKEILAKAMEQGYQNVKCLMMGDAPGDMNAAAAVGILYFPINPGHEDASWERFYNEGLQKFLDGTFAGAYQQELIDEFNTYLPSTPPWKK
jgi:phosphoglycolate phosphatase-like HAD superfamily hydrolase